MLPTPAGTCPDFASGAVKFSPTSTQRDVTLYMTGDAKTKHGPLIFYFYGTYGSPADARQGLSASLTAIEAAGGIVAAPTSISTGQYPWLGSDLTPDFKLVDEIVGCAIQKVGIDTSHIHALGFSAGALFVTQLAFARSDYLASIGTYSGGLTGGATPTEQLPSNKWPAMVMTGGTSDNVFNTDFLAASTALQTALKSDGHLAMLCNHGGGHSVPSQYTGPVWQFFQDNAYGKPSPYTGGLPSGFTNCTQ